ncbi:hypothetical protein J6590_012922 [Homalodisca vitripennis]|nr:hypothetical protein J6590_012922 [Homalodisca vitripennis]
MELCKASTMVSGELKAAVCCIRMLSWEKDYPGRDRKGAGRIKYCEAEQSPVQIAIHQSTLRPTGQRHGDRRINIPTGLFCSYSTPLVKDCKMQGNAAEIRPGHRTLNFSFYCILSSRVLLCLAMARQQLYGAEAEIGGGELGRVMGSPFPDLGIAAVKSIEKKFGESLGVSL